LGSRAEEIRRSRRLFGYGLGAIALCLCFYSYRAQVADPFHLYLGQIIIILSVLPSLLWAKRAKFGLPLFEVFMLTGDLDIAGRTLGPGDYIRIERGARHRSEERL
jgi:hypothetical protein